MMMPVAICFVIPILWSFQTTWSPANNVWRMV